MPEKNEVGAVHSSQHVSTVCVSKNNQIVTGACSCVCHDDSMDGRDGRTASASAVSIEMPPRRMIEVVNRGGAEKTLDHCHTKAVKRISKRPFQM